MIKVGRNEKCPCGSGKKYKKCCLNMKFSSEQIPPEVTQHFMEIEQSRLEMRNLGIHVNYVNPIIHQGKRVWALGSRIYPDRPEHETFHEFVIFVLQHTLGKQWFDDEASKPQLEQHFIYKSFIRFNEWRMGQAVPKNAVDNGWASIPDGWSQSLVSLAFDVASLQHANRLPDILLERLKGYKSYQAARHEIGVAAIFARLGFDICYIEPMRHGPKHCEFIAHHHQSGTRIAVEAKSRHRQGVLHHPGTTEEFRLAKGDVGTIYHQALEKDEVGKMPFMVFIDVNCPMTVGENAFEKRWVADITKHASENEISAENPDPCNAKIFTNFSPHYETENLITRNGEFVMVIPDFIQNSLQDPTILDHLYTALNSYGKVPNIQTRD